METTSASVDGRMTKESALECYSVLEKQRDPATRDNVDNMLSEVNQTHREKKLIYL